MIVLDACVLIATMDGKDAHHEPAWQVIRRAVQDERALVSHTLTVAEVLVSGTKEGRGRLVLAELEEIGIHRVTWEDEDPLRLAELRATTGLKLPDCCVLDTAMMNGAALATYDQTLAKAASQQGVSVLN